MTVVTVPSADRRDWPYFKAKHTKKTVVGCRLNTEDFLFSILLLLQPNFLWLSTWIDLRVHRCCVAVPAKS